MAARLTVASPTALCAATLMLCLPAAAQSPSGHAESIFEQSCAECHTAAGDDRTPGVIMLRELSPRAIVASLEDGVMQREGENLTSDERILLAEYLSRREYSEQLLPDAASCSNPGFRDLDLSRIRWMGYGGDLAGTGYQPAERAGLEARDVSTLELQWAFAFPDAAQARTKPTVVGDAVLVGGPFGRVLSLDLGTGCVQWSFEADAAVRGAILVGPGPVGQAVAYFVDFRTNAYALEVATGELLWRYHVGWHSTSNTTGSPALYDGKLIVPISSWEVATAGDPTYECCTASGAVAAMDALTGDVLWYHRVIEDDPVEVGVNAVGTTRWAPSGAPVWSSPTIDPERGLVYFGTGENYTRPTTDNSDAILAVDLETGELAWSFQGTAQDAFIMACIGGRNRENCPTPPGPDVDFGMAPILVERPDGKEILVAGQKSGTVWALDPDRGGEVLWATQVGKGGVLGGIHWGMATDGRYVYAANADRGLIAVDVNPDKELSPGLYALDLMDGTVVWASPAPSDTCADKAGCYAANSAAPTVVPGVVFAGGLDGHIRAHATDDGRVLWAFDTTRITGPVNGVEARGGAIDGPGPVVADGMLFVNSGYGMFNQMPGNLLLAFAVNSGR